MIVTTNDVAIYKVMIQHLKEQGISENNDCIVALKNLHDKLFDEQLKQS